MQKSCQAIKSCVFLIIFASSLGFAQAAPTPSGEKTCGAKHLDQCLRDLLHDQAGIWTSPLRVQPHDALWLVPLAGATGAAIYYDADALRRLGPGTTRIRISRDISRFGSPFATLGEGLGLYAVGALAKDDRISETGRLGAEAVIDASIVDVGLKLATNRERPDQGFGTGRFWPHGARKFQFDSSFPSAHATTSWALARVVASEYPGPLTKLVVYGFATAVSITRVTGNNHFPSDALVGSAIGYLIGGYVYRHHAAGGVDNTFMLMPDFNQQTHTYGARLEISPSALAHPVRELKAALR